MDDHRIPPADIYPAEYFNLCIHVTIAQALRDGKDAKVRHRGDLYRPKERRALGLSYVLNLPEDQWLQDTCLH